MVLRNFEIDVDHYVINNQILGIKCLYNLLEILNNKIPTIILNIPLGYTYFIKDILILLQNYCSIFFLLDYRFTEVRYSSVNLILRDFWKINELKQKLKEILDLNIKENNQGFLENIDYDKFDIIKLNNKINDFIYLRYINFYKVIGLRELTEEEINTLIWNAARGILANNIKINPAALPWLIKTMNTKVMEIKDKKIKLHSAINFPEADFLYNIILKNKCFKIIEVGMAYGISSLFICFALKKMHRELKLEKGLLTSIDPFQDTQWENIGRLNLEKADLLDYNDLILSKSELALPKLVKNFGEQSIDLIFIDGWHTFDATLIDLYYSTKLLKLKGLLIIDDIKHPGVAKVARYIESNLTCYKRINSPVTLGVYILASCDKRTWDYHKPF